MKKKVIFACVHGAGRSQMCTAFFNALIDPTKAYAIAAGSEPATKVHPEVVEVMKELGIDISQSKPLKLTIEVAQDADLLVTLGCGERCPYIPGLKIEDWPLADPKGKDLRSVRLIRDEIKVHVQKLVLRYS